jgi:hypothetical protein
MIFFLTTFVHFVSGTTTEPGWSMWQPSDLDLFASISQPEDKQLGEVFYQRSREVIKLRDAFTQYILYLEEKKRDMPTHIEKALRKLQETVDAFNGKFDCSSVDISGENVPEETVAIFRKMGTGEGYKKARNELLSSLSKRDACWLMNDLMMKYQHKLESKEISVSRLIKMKGMAKEFIAEIDSVFASKDVPIALGGFWWRNMDTSSATIRGQWAMSVKTHMDARSRSDAIHAEIKELRYSKSDSRLAGPLCDTIQSELDRVVDLHFVRGLDIFLGTSDSLLRRVLDDGLACFPRHKVHELANKTLNRIGFLVKEISSQEQTLSFKVSGDSPIGKYLGSPLQSPTSNPVSFRR